MIQLSLPAQDTSWAEVNANTIDVKVLILYPFYVEADKNGNSFNITKEDVYAVFNKYNETVKFRWMKLQKIGKNIPIKYVEHIANILDHDPKALNIVGRVIGELEIVERDDLPYLFATLRVKGKDNVERVKDNRFSQVSIGLNTDDHELMEISWVVTGAIPGAGAVMSNGAKPNPNLVTTPKEYNQANLLNLRLSLFSQYEDNQKKIEEIQNEIDIEGMLTTLAASGKLLPRDKLKIKTQLKKIPDSKARFADFNLLSENLITVVDYSVRAKNKLSINLEENLMSVTKGNGVLDLQKIAANCAINLAKGHKGKLSEESEKNELSTHEDKADMSEEKTKFSKKDLKHCLSIKDDEKELSKYLSTFLSEEGEDEEAEADMSKEKELGKFSEDMKKLSEGFAELKKQNEDLLGKIAVLSKGNEDSIALYNKIIDLQKV